MRTLLCSDTVERDDQNALGTVVDFTRIMGKRCDVIVSWRFKTRTQS